MSSRLNGKIIFLTGASGGLGRAMAKALSASGARVVLGGRDRDKLRRLADELPRGAESVRIETIDVCSQESVQHAVDSTVKQLGRIDILINNAGVCLQGSSITLPLAELQRELDVNYFGALRAARAVLPHMIRRGGGAIVNVASILGAVAYPSMSNYSASKAALLSLCSSMRGELGHVNVDVVAFMPSHSTDGMGSGIRLQGPRRLPATKIAEQLVAACERPKREVVCGASNRLFLAIGRAWPWLGESTMLRFARSSKAVPG